MTRPPKRLAIYAHYDPSDRIKPYVTHSLERLRADTERIIFVSTSRLSSAEKERVRPFCDTVMERENTGFDFAMWQGALHAIDYAAYDEVVLANSSVIGPLQPLAPIFARMSQSKSDFWGMTESAAYALHLQSYFLVFRSRLLRSEPFAAFWRSVLPYRDKMQVIRSYEIGLTRFFAEQGFRYDALVRAIDFGRKLRRGRLPNEPLGALPRARRTFDAWRWRNKELNPTHLYPLELVELGVPFVKCIHFRDNPRRLPMERLFEALERRGYPRSLLAGDARC